MRDRYLLSMYGDAPWDRPDVPVSVQLAWADLYKKIATEVFWECLTDTSHTSSLYSRARGVARPNEWRHMRFMRRAGLAALVAAATLVSAAGHRSAGAWSGLLAVGALASMAFCVIALLTASVGAALIIAHRTAADESARVVRVALGEQGHELVPVEREANDDET